MHEADALPGSISAVGYEAVKRYIERFGTHWKSFSWDLLEMEVFEDHAVARGRLRLQGRESGIEVDRKWWYVFIVRDGKLLSQRGFDDREAALATLPPACRR